MPALHSMTQAQRIPITILTGFLGSGKTTLLKKLLSSEAAADYAVLINEFGDVGLDHLLVGEVDEEIMLLESGCVCCSVRDDFSVSLLNLHHRRATAQLPPFQHVILETTGIADPIAIHELLLSDQAVRERFFCGQVIVVFDSIHGQVNLDRHIEAVKQVSVADKIVVSKTDLCDRLQLRGALLRLDALNSKSRYHCTSDSPVPQGLFDVDNVPEPLPPPADAAARPTHVHDARFFTFTLSWPEAVDWDDFTAWLEALLIAWGENIHRLKGLLRVRGDAQPTVIQGVQHSFYPPSQLAQWPDDEPRTQLVLITSDFTRQAAINSLTNVLDVTVD